MRFGDGLHRFSEAFEVGDDVAAGHIRRPGLVVDQAFQGVAPHADIFRRGGESSSQVVHCPLYPGFFADGVYHGLHAR